MALDDNFKVTLLKLSEELKQEEFEKIKFTSKVPKGVLEQCERPFQFFDFLIKTGSISENDCSSLGNFLENVHRNDLIDKFFDGDRLRLRNEPFSGDADPVDTWPLYTAQGGRDLNIFENPAPSDISLAQTSHFAESDDESSVSRAPSSSQAFGTIQASQATEIGEVVNHIERLETLKPLDFSLNETEVKTVVENAGNRPTVVSHLEDYDDEEISADELHADGAVANPEILRSDGSFEHPSLSVAALSDSIKGEEINLTDEDHDVEKISDEERSFFQDGKVSELIVDSKESTTMEEATSDESSFVCEKIDEDVFRRLPTTEDGNIDHDKIEEQLKLFTSLRYYQKSMAEAGLRGENSIIVLQTGGGKTHIAAYITKYHCMKAAIEGKKFLCLFLVPIRHLADQQKKLYDDTFECLNSQNLRIGNAKDTSEFIDCVRNKEVVCCTAQILVNALLIKNYNFKLDQVSLIIMDECHHTSGKHPNNKVMQQYIITKFEPTEEAKDFVYQPSNGGLPQIIGLSASLGAGEKTKSNKPSDLTKQALKQLGDMCASLDSSEVRFPRTQAEVNDLRRQCPDPSKEEILPVRRRFDSGFSDFLFRFVKDAVGFLDKPIDLRDMTLGEQEALTKIDKIMRECEENDKERNVAAGYLKEFSKAFSFLKILRCRDVVTFLNTNERLPFLALEDESEMKFINQVKNLWRERVKDLEKFSVDVDEKANPILDKLKEKLLNLFSSPDARGILLVQHKFSTVAAIDIIKSDEALSKVIRPVRLVGQDEMSDLEVEKNLNRFRNGYDNLLVATDIAQEGIDIPQCNVVIRYHFVSNEIGATQAVGRARKEGSQCYLIVIGDSPEHQREIRNKNLIKAMNDALDRYAQVFREDPARWTKKIRATQDKIYKTKRAERENRKKYVEMAVDYDIVCAKCFKLICPADKIVKIKETNHHLVTDHSVEDRIARRDLTNFRDHGGEVDRLNQILCGHCIDNKIGVEITFRRGTSYRGPQITLKAESVKYADRKTRKPQPPYKFSWKNAPFKIKCESFQFDVYDDFDDDDDDDNMFSF